MWEEPEQRNLGDLINPISSKHCLPLPWIQAQRFGHGHPTTTPSRAPNYVLLTHLSDASLHRSCSLRVCLFLLYLYFKLIINITNIQLCSSVLVPHFILPWNTDPPCTWWYIRSHKNTPNTSPGGNVGDGTQRLTSRCSRDSTTSLSLFYLQARLGLGTRPELQLETVLFTQRQLCC